ncbi:MAG: tRNA 5-methoxyuridine(34)/uridine 5-oxyacetic acid(34) synthase CmoB [Pseudomonadota bacterium]
MNRHDWEKTFYLSILDTPLSQWLTEFSAVIKKWKTTSHHADQNKWEKQLLNLPAIETDDHCFSDTVSVGSANDLPAGTVKHLRNVLKCYMPWRKGPYSLFGIDIDTEWRSDFKWQRIAPHLPDLYEKRVLDVGCGSGYHLFRMQQSGASQVIGIDPTTLFFYQFLIFKGYLPDINIHFLPLPLEKLPDTASFDVVFCMGVLYHRQDPLGFLKSLKNQLNNNGQLIIETLIIEGNANHMLTPIDRYAQMRNVFFIPSASMLQIWLKKVGFKQISMIEQNYTSIEEQRRTEWMKNHSLVDFLNPNDHRLTIEGYQAPLRATFIASK